jgi:hypothetical protein
MVGAASSMANIDAKTRQNNRRKNKTTMNAKQVQKLTRKQTTFLVQHNASWHAQA